MARCLETDTGPPLYETLGSNLMKRTYKFIKLKTETVQDLKRLMTEMGLGSLDNLVNTMIRMTDEYRFVFKGASWHEHSKGDTVEK